MAAKHGPNPTYTYRPKMGDVVIFPNGIELNYSEADEAIVVMGVPADDVLQVHPAAGSNGSAWLLVVTQ